ncbi:hypothetical protein TcasGA2_TC032427 [Tribolium castaneum]|uniref:Gustatory receptor n=1 Tax=Tribolium castaneum TaxID=7070 RepID=A0A139WLE1_TRICA|nr:hypothetical protein TcasGA2_TC032427 [Tribolium castaneum]
MTKIKKWLNKIIPHKPYQLKNCVVCVLTYTLFIGHYVTPIVGYCSHSNHRYSKTQYFAIVKISQIFDWILLLLYAGATFSYSNVVVEECSKVKNKIMCLHFWGDQIFSINGLLCMFFFLLQINTRLKNLNAWAHLIENRHSFKMENVICVHCTKNLMKRNFKLIAVLMAAILFFIGVQFWMSDMTPLDFTRRGSIFLSELIQCNIAFQFSQKSLFLLYITNSLKKSIVRKFQQRLELGTNLEDSLRNYTKFCHSNHRYSKTQYFAIVKISQIFDWILLLLYAGATFSYSNVVVEECSKVKNKIMCLHFWGDQIFSINGLLCMFFFLLQINTRLKNLNAWAHLIENRHSFKMENVICVHCTKNLMKRNFKLIAVLMAAILFFIGVQFWMSDMTSLDFTRRGSIFLSELIQCNIAFQFSQKSLFLLYITNSLKKSIVRKFRQRLEIGTNLEDSLRNYTKFCSRPTMTKIKKWLNKIIPHRPYQLKNCVVCVLTYTLFVGHYVTPIVGYCSHSNHRYSKTQYFAIVKISQIFDWILLLLYAGATFSYSNVVVEECSKVKNKIMCLHFWGDQIFSINGLLCMFFFLLQINTRLKNLNAWAHLIENRHSFKMENVICVHCTKNLMKRNFKLIAVLMAAILFFIGVQFWMSDMTPLDFTRRGSIFLSELIQCNIAFQFSQKSLFLLYITNSLKKSIVRKFRQRLEIGTNLEDSLRNYTKFWIILKKYQNLIRVLNMNIALMMKYFVLTSIIFSLSSVIALIVNIYILIKYFDLNALALGTLELRTVATIWSNLHIAAEVEKTINRRRVKMAGDVLQALQNSIKATLTDKLHIQTNLIRLQIVLKKYRNLIGALNLNLALLMDYLFLACVVFTLTSIISLIMNIYISIKYFDFDTLALATLELRTATTICSNFFSTAEVERSINKKSLQTTLDRKTAKMAQIFEAYNDALLAIYSNTKVLSKFVAPTSMIWNLTSIISLILHTYATIKFLDTQTICFIHLRTAITVVELCFYYFSAEISLQCKPSARPEYRFSLPVLIFDGFMFIFVFFAWITYFIYPPRVCKTDQIHCLIFLGEQIIATTSILIGFLEVFHISEQVVEFNSWAKLIHERNFYGFKDIMTDLKLKRFLRFRESMMILNFVSTVGITFLIFDVSKDNFPWNEFRKVLSVVCYSFQSYITLDLSQKVRIVGIILETFKHTASKALTRNIYPIFGDDKSLTLEAILRKFNKFFRIAYTNMTLFMAYIRTILILYCLAVIASLILNVYILIKFDNYEVLVFVLVQSRVLYMISRIVTFFVAAECNLQVKWDPFRFLYPIKGYCPHSKNYSPEPQFKLFKSSHIIVYLFTLPNLISAISGILQLPVLWTTDRLLFLIFLADQVFIMSSFILGIITCLQLGAQFNELNAWADIIRIRRFFGVKSIFDERATKRLLFYRKVFSHIINIFMLCTAAIHSVFNYDQFSLNYLRQFSIVFSMSFQGYLAFEFCYRMMMLGTVLKTLNKSLRKSDQRLFLAVTFSKFARLLMVINTKMVLIMKFIKFFFPVWILTMTVNLILNIYILVSTGGSFNNDTDDPKTRFARFGHFHRRYAPFGFDFWNGGHLRVGSTPIPRLLGRLVMYLSTKHTSPVFEVKKDTICICKMLRPLLYVGRFLGFLPIAVEHQGGKCVFKKSVAFICLSILIIGLLAFQVFNSIDFFHLTKTKSLPILLNNITDAIYGVYVIILIAINLYRFPRWVKTLNKFPSVLKEGIFCQSAMKIVQKIVWYILGVTVLAILFQVSLLTFLHFSQTYQTDFDYNFFINKLLQNISFIFYVIFFTVISVFIGILACFEKLTISCLKYTPVHPMKGINETNNTRDFFGLVTYKLCKEEHPCSGRLAKLPQAEVVEFLRILHEDISLVIYEINDCLNPQFLCHTVVELTVLIVQWYAVIVYMAFTFKAPLASSIHVVNCFFVVVHTLGIFLFLKNAQQLKNMIQGLNNFLLEYSTRISSLEEHQQGLLDRYQRTF